MNKMIEEYGIDVAMLESVQRFTDLEQVSGEYLHNEFDWHYNCVENMPCYKNDDWTLIINPAADVLMAHDDDSLNCWAFEWAVLTEEETEWSWLYQRKCKEVIGFLIGYCYGSPWQAFRAAMASRDAFIEGNDDGYEMI